VSNPLDEPDRDAAVRIGHNITRARARKEPGGISQEALAAAMRAAGSTAWRQSTVHKAESGQRNVNAAELERLALIFGVTVDRLLWAQGEDAAHMAAAGAIGRLREAAQDAARAVTRLHGARAAATRAADDAARSPYPRVREVADHIAGELAEATLDNVLAAAQARWEEAGSGG
jgi:transcriptional regulator with XRE-family HTH domain